MDAELSRLDRAIVNAYQGGFPVAEDPFDLAAAALRDRGVEVDADGLVARIRTLDENGVLSRFGPLLNADELGGEATLVAIHAPEERYDEVVAAINDRPEVAHNYAREHDPLNVWFVLSVADADRVGTVLDEIEAETGQHPYELPKRTEYRVEARFPVEGPFEDEGIDLSDRGSEDTAEPRTGADDAPATAAPADPTEAEFDLLAAVQDGLPITRTPYADVADDLDRDPEWVRATLRRFEDAGVVRRIGVVPNHYALGYSENGMTVWDVPDEAIDEVGPAVAALPFVTHCYERPRHDGVWPYNLFAMTHGRSPEESERRIETVRETVAERTEIRQWDTLFSTEILKKTGINVLERAREGRDADEDEGGDRGRDGSGDAGEDDGGDGGRDGSGDEGRDAGLGDGDRPAPEETQ